MSAQTTVLFILGTRPEAIKLAPLIRRFQQEDASCQVKICVTGQHRSLIEPLLGFFAIVPDVNLDIMNENQTLFDIVANTIRHFEEVLTRYAPSLIIAQGDTLSALMGTLAGFFKKIPIVHIEAGLRTYHKYAPFPEEMNRRLISRLVDYHFAPTEKAKKNLESEGIQNNIWVTGNTGIDALRLGLRIISSRGDRDYYHFFESKGIDFSRRIILMTGHRRENFGEGLAQICDAIHQTVCHFDDIEVIYPVHLNPNVKETVVQRLHEVSRIHLLDPLPYPYFIWAMQKSYCVVTDSGGIQEEAPFFGKPVLVTRTSTERMEGTEAGTAKLVGIQTDRIVSELSALLSDTAYYARSSKPATPYGDGTASEKIFQVLKTSSIFG